TAVDRRDAHGRELAQDVRQRPDVVLVAVREDDRLDVRGPLAQVREVRQDQIDPQLVRGREHQPGVHHDDAAVVLDDGHVLADLPQPPEREDAQGRAQDSWRTPRRWRTSRMTLFSSSEASTIGSRSPPTSTPIMLRAALTGVGLDVMNIALTRA